MLSQKQIQELSKYYSIDAVSIIREYLQLVFLNLLYQQKEGDEIYFKGGTAIHFLYNSPRFSEDLDFSTVIPLNDISSLLKDLEKDLQKEFSSLKIFPIYKGKNGIRYKINYQEFSLKYPLNIRLDFNKITKPVKAETSPIVTKFPVILFPVINHLSASEILAEKIRSVLTRNKGRDYFDLWYLLEKGVGINNKLITRKLAETGKKYGDNLLINKIKKTSAKKVELDLKQFLPAPYRKIVPDLKNRILKKLNH